MFFCKCSWHICEINDGKIFSCPNFWLGCVSCTMLCIWRDNLLNIYLFSWVEMMSLAVMAVFWLYAFFVNIISEDRDFPLYLQLFQRWWTNLQVLSRWEVLLLVYSDSESIKSLHKKSQCKLLSSAYTQINCDQVTEFMPVVIAILLMNREPIIIMIVQLRASCLAPSDFDLTKNLC